MSIKSLQMENKICIWEQKLYNIIVTTYAGGLKMASINERIKELRTSLGFSVDEFAKILGIHRSSVYRYEGENEKETRDVPMSLAILISEKFNVSLDWLGGLTDTKQPELSTKELTEVYASLNEEAKKELFNFANYLKNKV